MSAPRERPCWTASQVLALGVRTDVPTAYEILTGLGRDEAYRAVKRGTFPVPVLKIGRHLVVPTAPILELLRLAPQTTASRPRTTGTGRNYPHRFIHVAKRGHES